MRRTHNDDSLSAKVMIAFCLFFFLLLTSGTAHAEEPRLVLQTGHLQHVYCIAFTYDGKVLASGGPDNFIKLWDVDTGIILKTLKGHDGWVNSLSFSPDGKKLASGSYDKSVKIWDVDGGSVLRTYTGHSDTVCSVAFTSDGSRVVSGGWDKSIRLWDISSGQQLKNIPLKYDGPGAQGWIRLASDLNGKSVITGRQNNSIALWDIEAGRQLKTLTGPDGWFPSLAINSDASILAYRQNSDTGPTIKLWDVNGNRELSILKGPSTSEWGIINLSVDGRKLAVSSRKKGSSSESIELWDVEMGRELSTFPGHPDVIYSLVFSPDGRSLASGSRDHSTKLWDVNSGRELRTLKGYVWPVRSVGFSPDGRMLAFGTEDKYKQKSIQLWDLGSLAQLRGLRGHSDNVNIIVFSPDGSRLASGSRDKTIKLWDPKTGKDLKTLKCDVEVLSIAFSHDGKLLASGGFQNGPITVWDASTGLMLRKIPPGARQVNALAFSPDGRVLAAALGNNDNCAMHTKLWDLKTGKELPSLRGHSNDIKSISFSPDGSMLASGSADETVRLWQAATGKEIRTLRGHRSWVSSVKFSPDGKTLASGSADNSIKLWDTQTGKEIKNLSGHSNLVSSIAFSPDGGILASGSTDGTTKIWNTQTYNHITVVSAGDEWVTYSSNGREGYYDASPEASPLVTWVFSGKPKEEPFSFEQFESVFKRPDIIKKWLVATSDFEKPILEITRPPFIQLPLHKTIMSTVENAFPISLTTSAVDEVKALRVFVNGKLSLEVPVNAKEKELSLSVPLFPGANRITAIAYNEKGFSSNPKYVDVICNRTDLPKPNLYALGIGVSKYTRLPMEWQLSYAHTDAKAIVEAFKKQEGRLFGQVNMKLLSNEEANVAAISDVLSSLEGMSENDIAVLFLAGHGIMGKDGTFYYLTSEGSLEEPEKGGLSWKVLDEYLGKIKGRVIILLDACHSGNISTETVVPNDELAHRLSSEGRSGVMVFAASKGRQSALESPDLGGGFGAFAYAVTQTIGAKSKEADLNDSGYVEFMELVEYVGRSVDKETEGEQTPWLSRKELFGDLAIASVAGAGGNKALSIPRPPVSPREATPRSTSGPSQAASPTDSVNLIRSTIQSYYDSVQNKNVDRAISYYAAPKQPNIKRGVLEAVAKDTQSFRIEKMQTVEVGSANAKVMVYLFHKKINKPEEYWEITVELVNEDGQWRMWNTPGKKLR